MTDNAGLRGARLIGDRRVSSLLTFKWPRKKRPERRKPKTVSGNRETRG